MLCFNQLFSEEGMILISFNIFPMLGKVLFIYSTHTWHIAVHGDTREGWRHPCPQSACHLEKY